MRGWSCLGIPPNPINGGHRDHRQQLRQRSGVACQKLPRDLHRLGLNPRESVDIFIDEGLGSGYRLLYLSLPSSRDDDGGITIERWCPPRSNQDHMPFFSFLTRYLITGTKALFISMKTLSIRVQYPVKYPADRSHERVSHHWRRIFADSPISQNLQYRSPFPNTFRFP